MADESHDVLAEALRDRILHSGVIEPRLRRALIESEPLEAPYGELARDIADASYRVTDEQVAAVRAAAGSERAAFEVILGASAAAGLSRWDAAARAIREATDAPA